MADHPARALHLIANEIRSDWIKMPGAVAQLVMIMSSLIDTHDRYSWMSGRAVVEAFLANAGRWHGVVADRIKAELRSLI